MPTTVSPISSGVATVGTAINRVRIQILSSSHPAESMFGHVTVDEYLDAAPEPQQSTLRQLRSSLATLLPDAEEGLSYGVPAFKLDGAPVAGYAYFKGHCGFYPHSGSVLSQVEPELLTGYQTAKGTLRFPIDEPLPEQLLQRLVQLRLSELEG